MIVITTATQGMSSYKKFESWSLILIRTFQLINLVPIISGLGLILIVDF